jgi:HSP20 family protein
MARKQVKKSATKEVKKAEAPPPAPTRDFLADSRNNADDVFEHALRGWSNFGDLLSDWGASRDRDTLFKGRLFGQLPKTDIVEGDAGYAITIELPGVGSDDVDLSLTENRLTVKGEKRSEREEDEEGRHLTERSYGRFERSFVLPEDANTEKVEAGFDNGVLNIAVPKLVQARKKARKISVKANK